MAFSGSNRMRMPQRPICLIHLKVAIQRLRQHAPMWLPAFPAPYDRDVELAVIVRH